MNTTPSTTDLSYTNIKRQYAANSLGQFLIALTPEQMKTAVQNTAAVRKDTTAAKIQAKYSAAVEYYIMSCEC